MSGHKFTFGDVLSCLSARAPLDLQESYDNSGLLVGVRETPVRGVICCLDATETVLTEALSLGCNLIVSHHPPIFRGLRDLRGDTPSSRFLLRAIRSEVGLLAMHTNLDSAPGGVSHALGARFGLTEMRPLSPKRGLYSKLQVFVPKSHEESLKAALFAAGAGKIGEYTDCAYTLEGTGEYIPPRGSHPLIGAPCARARIAESRVEMRVRNSAIPRVMDALLAAHPYEEPAYDLIPLSDTDPRSGLGVVGLLPEPMPTASLLALARECLQTPVLRRSVGGPASIHRLALCGGSGADLIGDALRAGADAYLTADIKYHAFQDLPPDFLLIDAGHAESERVATEILYQWLLENFTTFAVHKARTGESPVTYSY